MKTKTKFDSTSDARNLINSVVEKFPKGPERDGLQTKLREFYNCFAGAMRLPKGYDRSKVIEEGTQNLHAAQRIADRIDKQNGNAKFSTMISILASNLTDLKRDHSKAGKVEDNFYGKRIVKGIFAKVRFAKEYILWAVPKGKTDTMYSQPIAEQLYTDAQINDVKRRATADGWHTFRIAEMMSFEDMTNVWKGKPVKRRSSRTGSKAKFDKSNYYALEGTVDGNATGSKTVETIEEAMYYGKAMLEHMKKQSPKAKVATVHIFKVVNYQRENTPVKVLNSRQGSKAKFANGGTKTASFLAKIDSKSKSMILENIAKNYGISARAAFAEVTDSEAENLLDYMTEPARSAASVLMQKHGSFARTGAKAKFSHLSTMLDMLDYQSANDQEDLAKKNIKGLAQSIGKLNPTKDEWSRYVKIAKSLGFSESQISGFARTGAKAKFQNIKVLSGTPMGATESKIIKEGSYSPTEWDKIIQSARKKFTNLFFLPYSSFYDLKGKKIRSSRTGAKVFK